MHAYSTALDKLRIVALGIATPAAIVLNYTADPGSEVRVVARDGEPLLAAAGWAFSIWALIFAGHLGYAIYQAFPSQHARPLHRRIGWLAAANSILGALWLYAFTARLLTLAWAIMIALLLGLAAIEILMRDEARSGRDYWLVRFPYSLNFGWISVATILNTTQWLAAIGYDGTPLGPVGWSLVLITAATSIAVAMILVRANVPFGLATAWGLVAIGVYRREMAAISIAALTGAIAILLICGAEYFLARRSTRHRGARPIESHGTS